MWAELWKDTPEGRKVLGVVLLADDGRVWFDVNAEQSREELEPLFDVPDITFAYVGYGDNFDPITWQRGTDRWFVAILNRLPEPYGFTMIDSRPQPLPPTR